MRAIHNSLGLNPEPYEPYKGNELSEPLAQAIGVPSPSSYAERQKAETLDLLRQQQIGIVSTDIVGDDFNRLIINKKLQTWIINASCKGLDPNIFFPPSGQNGAKARKICAECPARTDCLNYAITNGIKTGIWGGLSRKERDSYRIRRSSAARANKKQGVA